MEHVKTSTVITELMLIQKIMIRQKDIRNRQAGIMVIQLRGYFEIENERDMLTLGAGTRTVFMRVTVRELQASALDYSSEELSV